MPDSARMPSRLKVWGGSTFGHAALGAVLLWAALPPLAWWPLAWIAPIPWVLLIRRKELPSLEVAPPVGALWLLLMTVVALAAFLGAAGAFNGWDYRGFWLAEAVTWPAALWATFQAARRWRRRPYCTLWLVGFVFWLAALQWLRLPHWATGFGWIAMAFYFAFYLPAFIGLGRVAVHRLGFPAIVAAPVVWTGLELARATCSPA